MDSAMLLKAFENTSRVSLTSEELDDLLAAATIVREEDSCISGMLRILRLENGTIVVQEETPKKEVLVRTRPSLEAAQEFVSGRLEVYERMWDGCGCKINYEDP
ncbi:MAG: hypothetical protein P8Y93_04040 [Acidobacteriota bacterium]